MLSSEEKERYDRQLIMQSVGKKGQTKIKQSSVFIAGAGGLGSPLSLFLVAAGVGRIRIVDNGKVELSNLNRQILYRSGDIGKNKSDCAEISLQTLNPYVNIESVKEEIKDDNVNELVADCDIIVDALDNYPTRHLLNQFAFEKNIPLVHGAVEEFYGQVTTIIPGKTNCLQCLFLEVPEQRAWPIISVTCGLIASLQATEVIKLILGAGSLLQNRLLIYDGLLGRIEEIAIERTENCSICSQRM